MLRSKFLNKFAFPTAIINLLTGVLYLYLFNDNEFLNLIAWRIILCKRVLCLYLFIDNEFLKNLIARRNILCKKRQFLSQQYILYLITAWRGE